MQSIFKRLKQQLTDQITISQAMSDEITALESFRNKSCPTFLFYFVYYFDVEWCISQCC